MSLVPAASALVVRGSGANRWLSLPTGSQDNRRLMQALCINDEERAVAQMPSRDIEIRVGAGEDVRFFFAKLLRREGYFRAVLVQSRGNAAMPCAEKCARDTAHKFQECRRVATYQGGACAECVWQSHGARCSHHH